MSDLKITHAGTVQTQDKHGPINPAAPLGQAGSAFTDASSEEINPPLNQVFVAITMITDCTFDTSTGLIAEDSTRFINTAAEANGLAAGAETSIQGSGGEVVNSVIFPAGVTIYGRWTEIDVATGSCVAYIG